MTSAHRSTFAVYSVLIRTARFSPSVNRSEVDRCHWCRAAHTGMPSTRLRTHRGRAERGAHPALSRSCFCQCADRSCCLCSLAGLRVGLSLTVAGRYGCALENHGVRRCRTQWGSVALHSMLQRGQGTSMAEARRRPKAHERVCSGQRQSRTDRCPGAGSRICRCAARAVTTCSGCRCCSVSHTKRVSKPCL